MFLSKLLVDINNFDIKDPAGKGQYGQVYKAIRKVDKKHKEEMQCAVKVLLSDKMKSSDDQKHFHKEVMCQASLKHPAVLPLIGFTLPFMGKGDYAVITEFMPNNSLQSLIESVNKGGAPENWETIKAINIFGIAAGMAYIHQHNVIHRNLKPSNVFLDSNFYPKIGDFGLSKFFIEGTENELNQTLNVGTPIYMAPEVIENSHYSNKIDVFSYSIILYQLLTENEPYYDAERLNAFTLLKNVAGGVRPTICPCEINSQFMKLLERCWSGDPDNRPSFIQIVKKYMDCKDEFFNDQYLDDEQFDDYIEIVTKDLDFSNVEDFIL